MPADEQAIKSGMGGGGYNLDSLGPEAFEGSQTNKTKMSAA